MWADFYRGPLFHAAIDLLVAARTDPELRESLAGAHHDVFRWIEVGGPILYPSLPVDSASPRSSRPGKRQRAGSLSWLSEPTPIRTRRGLGRLVLARAAEPHRPVERLEPGTEQFAIPPRAVLLVERA